METNRDVEATWEYHEGTKHSFQSLRSSRHLLDYENQPLPFKIYSGLEPIPLPRELEPSGVPALEALAASPAEAEGKRPLDLKLLARLLHYSAGVTKRIRYPKGEMLFRAASCTGALYHIDLYLVCEDLPDLEAGVYHFGAHDFALRQLRRGDFRGELVRATAGESAVASAPATLICSSTFWRNSWKYQARAYRHCFWDSGTILANLLAVGNANQIPLKLVTSFVDEPVNRLLDLDASREVALQLVPVGRDPADEIGPPLAVDVLDLEVAPYSRREESYPAMVAMHSASSLLDPGEISDLWGKPPTLVNSAPTGPMFPLVLTPETALPEDTLEETILRRGSSRRFRRAAITFEQLSNMLDRATRGIAADFLDGSAGTLNQLYLIVNDVEDLPQGSYVFHRDRDELEQLAQGDFRVQAGHLDLGQPLAADASVNVYILTDLKSVLDRYGNRGYRMAQVEASIMGGRIYLGAYAQRLGATGLTFFDDEVTEFFSPHAEGKSVMFLVAVGRRARRR
ncbi:MAG: SagB/ThcOx family dehydrogenase [Chloroflexi bacterium]|nr:SagB/ThcOx family dehydrogenase [Chloroflexota bacterium]